ncbi:MAG: ABC transporter substrate-binding protein [Candidatus Cloacimonetes bacterium]|nr:ABC transporter substrate-binding protein [Candidatus Cloacimonadota bacterium]MCK9515594.1 ABC transporter substrate-binding protein [Ottowia sp.]
MRNSRRQIIKTIGAGGLGIVVPAISIKSVFGQQSQNIKIGFPTPLTGPFSAEAKDQVQAAQLAIKHFNENGGLNGRMAELLVRDDKLKPGEAATRTLELIENDKVDFLVGALSASVQLAVNEVAKARGVIYNSISQSDAINESSDFSKYTFHEALNPHMTAGAVGRHVFKKGQKIAFLTADYAYGHEMVNGFKNVAEEMGLTVLADIRHPAGATDYSIFLPRIQNLRPDVLAICNFGRDQLNSIKQATSFGLKKQMQIVVPVLLYNQRLAGSPDAFEGVIGAANYHWTLEEQSDSARKFNDAYRKEYGGAVPSDYGAYGYVGVKTILDAVLKVESTAADDVIAELEAMKYDYYKGVQYFRKCDHQSVQPILIISSKKESEMRNEFDVFDILEVQEGSEDVLRSCNELGLA